MFKPLLRTMPSLSGNMKLVCFLDNFNEIEENIYESNVRSARLNAISSQLFNKYLNLSLLGSSYEWDVKSFYKKYSEYFYKNMFEYNKIDLPMYSEFGTNKNRNTDFEYGCKRISYMKSSKQFGFYAPIYIESTDDIPDYFEINIDIDNSIFRTNRKIRVNIGNKLEDGPNYIGKYIYDYAKKIDDKVCYVNKDEYEGIYYGIDVVKGGLNKKHDIKWQSLLTKQNSILNFDNVITKGFERNRMIMKQIIPLSFYFSLNDILSEIEKTMFYGAELKITGAWFKNGLEIPFYDFSTNYSVTSPQILLLNEENGVLNWRIPITEDDNNLVNPINIMNIGYPSMKEALFYKYRFTNKVAPSFFKWKLKYSNDEHPYVTNMSAAFSLYQDSKTKYGQFPTMYETLTGVVTKKPFYLNLFLPLNGGQSKYPQSTVEKYINTQNKYSSNWFETFENIKDALNKCVDVKDDKAYFNGILYNMNILKQLTPQNKPAPNIDKFGVFVRPIFHFVSDDAIKNETIYSRYTIFKENSNYIIDLGYPNCHVNDNVLVDENPQLFNNQQTKVKRDMLSMNMIFLANKEDNGDFISLAKYGVDWYEANDFVRLEDLKNSVTDNVYIELSKLAKSGYEILPISRLSNIIDSHNKISYKFSNTQTCYIANQSASIKMALIEDMTVNGKLLDSKFQANESNLYRESKFISRDVVIDTIKNAYITYALTKYPSMNAKEIEEVADIFTEYSKIYEIYPLCSYQFNPILQNTDGIVYSKNVFTSSYMQSSRFYGDEYIHTSEKIVPKRMDLNKNAYIKVPAQTYSYVFDKDFIYVDPYNINNIISHYNNTWLKDDKPLSYYSIKDRIWREPILSTTLMGDLDFSQNPVALGKVNFVENWYSLSDEYKDTATQFIDNYLNMTYGYNEETRKYESGFTFELFRGPNISVRLVNENYDNLSDLINSSNNEKKYEHKGKFYSSNELSAANQILGFELDVSENMLYDVKCIFALLYSTAGLQNTWVKNQPNVILMDELHSVDIPVKFLNKMHLRYFFKCLYSQDPSQFNYSTADGYLSFKNIFIRKRVVRDDLSVQDALIPIKNIFDYNNILGNPEDAINAFLRVIDFDEESGLFFFNSINYKKGKIYKFNSNVPINSQLLFWNLENYIEKTYDSDGNIISEQFNPKKFKFELVFKKQMIKVDDNLWRLINLEETYAAPYKDLYIYEYEHPEDYNKNLFIQPSDVFFGYGGESNHDKCSLINTTYNMIGGLMPMFNIVQIETKDESKIYTEYSINNITCSKINDKKRIDVYEEYKQYNPQTGGEDVKYRLVSSRFTYFYRHNSNNALCMFDLSTINREVPMDIKGTKYIYKNSLKYDIKDPAFADLPTASYEYFHDTYDLFKLNDVQFANYADVETTYIPVREETIEVENIIPVKASYNSDAFKDRHEDLFNQSQIYTEPGIYEVANYIDEEHIERSYKVEKHIIPTKPIQFFMQSYQLVTTYEPTEIYDYSSVYSYYNDLKIYDDFYLSTYNVMNDKGEQTTYGFYLIDVNINNTTNCFNVVSHDGDNLKYVSYVNGLRLEENQNAITYLYKQLMPFLRNNPLKYFMTNAYTVMHPTLFNIPLDYHPNAVYDNNGRLTYYDVLFNKGKYGNIVCERYFDEITPILTKTNSLLTYNIKYKDIKKGFKTTYFTNEVIYPLQTSVNQYPGVRVYNMLRQSEYRVENDYEYKHFNDNKTINLEEKFVYVYDDLLTLKELRIAQSNTRVFDVFRDHMLDYTSSKLDDKGIEWAFTKYKVEFAYEATKLDSTKSEKLYKLEIIFTLY